MNFAEKLGMTLAVFFRSSHEKRKQTEEVFGSVVSWLNGARRPRVNSIPISLEIQSSRPTLLLRYASCGSTYQHILDG